MIWLAWRQFRTQALVTVVLLGAFAALLLVTGLHLRDVYDSLGGAHCGARGDCSMLSIHEPVLRHLLPVALTAIPALLGMFWGAPLLARELESGTYRLAWTQTVTPRRWLLTKAALVGVAALAVAGLCTWLVSWWFAPLDAIEMNRFAPSIFSARGILAVGYAGFAIGLGLAAGAFMRRTLPAMAATLFGFIAVRLPFTLWVRPHLLSATQTLIPLQDGQRLGFVANPSGAVTVSASSPAIPNAWPLSSVLVDHAHRALNEGQLHRLLAVTCPKIGAEAQENISVTPGHAQASIGSEEAFNTCLQALSHHVQLLVSYLPANQYWPLQILETAIFLAAGCALIHAVVWRVSRRPGRKPQASQSHGPTVERLASEPAPKVGAPH